MISCWLTYLVNAWDQWPCFFMTFLTLGAQINGSVWLSEVLTTVRVKGWEQFNSWVNQWGQAVTLSNSQFFTERYDLAIWKMSPWIAWRLILQSRFSSSRCLQLRITGWGGGAWITSLLWDIGSFWSCKFLTNLPFGFGYQSLSDLIGYSSSYLFWRFRSDH